MYITLGPWCVIAPYVGVTSTDVITDYSEALPGVEIHFHELMVILAAVALIINTLLSLYLVWGHCFHWTKPMEQKQ